MDKPMSEQMQKLAERYERATGKKFGQQTNADRIRAMTDKELAEWLHDGVSSDPCDYCEHNTLHCSGSPCKGKADTETIIDWLKQPYGGTDHDKG